MPEHSHAYAAFRECGCICAAAVDNPEHKSDVAREVAQWLRAGLRVQRLTVEEVRAADWHCPHEEQEE